VTADSRSGTRTSVPGLAAIAGLTVATLIALTLGWARAAGGWTSFGLDLTAYEQAADRLVETGSPYSAELKAGPIDNDARNVSIGYFYPPPLAQLFTLVRNVDHRVLATTWTVLQAVAAFIVLPLVWRRSGGRPHLIPLLWLVAFAIASYPFQFALIVGNVSGWSALLVAVALVTQPRVQGLVAGGLGLLKTVNVPILAVAVAHRPSRLPALALVIAAVAVSVLLAPGAWLAWLDVLPNLLALPPGGAPDSVSPASMLRDSSLGGVAAALGSLAAVGLLILAALLVRSWCRSRSPHGRTSRDGGRSLSSWPGSRMRCPGSARSAWCAQS